MLLFVLKAFTMGSSDLNITNGFSDMECSELSYSELSLTNGFKYNPEEYGSNFKIIPINDQIIELQTVLRDK